MIYVNIYSLNFASNNISALMFLPKISSKHIYYVPKNIVKVGSLIKFFLKKIRITFRIYTYETKRNHLVAFLETFVNIL
jgi:hypothetical protein